VLKNTVSGNNLIKVLMLLLMFFTNKCDQESQYREIKNTISITKSFRQESFRW